MELEIDILDSDLSQQTSHCLRSRAESLEIYAESLRFTLRSLPDNRILASKLFSVRMEQASILDELRKRVDSIYIV